jgi:NitT/TauT family transport system substrate-binding protein
MYMQVGQITGSFPQWRSVVDVSILKEIKGLEGAMHAAEAQFTYAKPTAAIANAQPMATKPVSIVFATGSYTLDHNAKTIIDMQVVDPLKNIAGTYVRITGNTDNTGDYNRNKDLSLKRAEASIDYLVSLGFNRDRFIAKGNGQDNPVADNSTEAGRALNRRTDFELIKK